jgi:hypothetical protein
MFSSLDAVKINECALPLCRVRRNCFHKSHWCRWRRRPVPNCQFLKQARAVRPRSSRGQLQMNPCRSGQIYRKGRNTWPSGNAGRTASPTGSNNRPRPVRKNQSFQRWPGATSIRYPSPGATVSRSCEKGSFALTNKPISWSMISLCISVWFSIFYFIMLPMLSLRFFKASCTSPPP